MLDLELEAYFKVHGLDGLDRTVVRIIRKDHWRHYFY